MDADHHGGPMPPPAGHAGTTLAPLALLGCWILGLTAGLVATVGWFLIVTLPFAYAYDSLEATPHAPRSIAGGIALGMAAVALQIGRMVFRRGSRLLSTCVVTAVVVCLGAVSAALQGQDAPLAVFWLTTWFVVLVFSLAHVFGAVSLWTARSLRAAARDSRVAGVVAASSLLGLTPFCAAPVVGDEVARLAEPAGELDGQDVARAFRLAAVVEGEDPSLACLARLEPHRAEAVGVAERRGSLGRADAEDVVGDVLMAVCVPPKAKGDLKAYFFRSVQNRAVDPHRRESRWSSCPRCPTPESSLPPADLACDERWVRTQVGELQKDLRRVVVMHAFEGFSLGAIGEKLGIGKSTAHRRWLLGLQQLQEQARVCTAR